MTLFFNSRQRINIGFVVLTLIYSITSLSAQPTGFSKPTHFSVITTTKLTGIKNYLLINTSDGGVLCYGKYLKNNAIISKLSTLGVLQWEKQLNPDSGIDVTNMVEVNGEKYVLSGYFYSNSEVGGSPRKWSALLDNSGQIIWQMPKDTSSKRYFRVNSPLINCTNHHYAVLADNGLNVFAYTIQPVLRFYDEEGVLIREAVQDTLHTDLFYVRTFFQTNDGGFGALFHTRLDDSTFQQFWRFDSTGKLLWKKKWADVQYSQFDFYSSAIETKEGCFIVATTAPTDSDTSFIIVRKFDTNGDLLFKKHFGNKVFNAVAHMQETPEENIVIFGFGYDEKQYSGADMYILKTNRDGKLLWQESFGDSTTGDYGTSISVVDEHTFYIGFGTGKTEDFTSGTKPYLVKISDLVSAVKEPIEIQNDCITLSPNPVSTSCTVSGLDDVAEMKLVNSLGMTVVTWEVGNGDHTFNVNSIANGMYFMQLNTREGRTSKAIIVHH